MRLSFNHALYWLPEEWPALKKYWFQRQSFRLVLGPLLYYSKEDVTTDRFQFPQPEVMYIDKNENVMIILALEPVRATS